MIAADVYRPAAIEQLKTLGRQIGLPVYEHRSGDPVRIVREGVAEAKRLGISTAIVERRDDCRSTKPLMDELAKIKVARPREILLVADAMTGQEATAVAKGFHERLGIPA